MGATLNLCGNLCRKRVCQVYFWNQKCLPHAAVYGETGRCREAAACSCVAKAGTRDLGVHSLAFSDCGRRLSRVSTTSALCQHRTAPCTAQRTCSARNRGDITSDPCRLAILRTCGSQAGYQLNCAAPINLSGRQIGFYRRPAFPRPHLCFHAAESWILQPESADCGRLGPIPINGGFPQVGWLRHGVSVITQAKATTVPLRFFKSILCSALNQSYVVL